MSTHTESLTTGGDGTADPDRATLAWEAADGRRGWEFSDAQREEILSRRAQGEDFTLGPGGEIIFFPRKSTDRRWWMRGPDDANVKAAQRAKRLYVTRGHRVTSTFSAHSRRRPSARPAARRPAARRSLGARAGQDPGNDDPDPHDGAARLARFLDLPTPVQGAFWRVLARQIEGGRR